MKFSTSKKLIKNSKNFLNINYYTFFDNVLYKKGVFYGWGRKKSGQKAVKLAKKHNTTYVLLEDGFIRSIGLGIKKSPSFSVVEDNIGIYYDATVPSKLENILASYDFKSDENLLHKANEAIKLIKKYHISKYNHAPDLKEDYFKDKNEKRILIIAQTAGDSSLEYGRGYEYTTNDMIKASLNENPNHKIYLKIHPDVLSGKKSSDISIQNIPKEINLITEDINPISLLKYFDKVYTKTSSMGFEALLVGCECVCFGIPFYAGWGLTEDRIKCNRRKRNLLVEEVFAAAYILYSRYYNPYTKKKSDIIDTIKTINKLKKLELKKDKKLYLFGFSRWKHGFIRDFLKNYKSKNIIFINPVFSSHHKLALKKGLNKNSEIFFWGRKEFKEIENFAKSYNITITRVEDGFIRSVGLGSDLTRPFSLVFDDKGIYFDPATPSRLENILNNYNFDENILKQAKNLRKKILKTKISKYNTYSHKTLSLPKNKTNILVSGQVEDDASIKFGANSMTNLELIKQVKKENPNAYIIFKPHPDVLSGNRIGNIPNEKALRYCDEIVVDISMSSILQTVDEVHTMTSLTGFEGLLYDKKVVTYGMPFYASWGLTTDKKECKRRKRKLSLDELIAGVYLLYPRYIHPKTLEYCSASILIDELEKERKKIKNNIIYDYKNRVYSNLSRTIQKLISLVK